MNENLTAAVQLHLAGHLTQAEEIYQALLDSPNVSSDTFYMYGLLKLHQGSEEGVGFIKKAIKAAPKNAKPYINLSLYYKEKEKFDDALNVLKACVDNCGESAVVLLEIIGILKHEKRDLESIECYLKLVVLEPNNAIVFYNMGNVYKELLDFKAAEIAYVKAIKLKSFFPEAYMNLGLCLDSQQKLEEAVEAFDMSNTQRPNHLNTLRYLADVYFRKGLVAESFAYATRALSIQKDDYFALNCLMRCKYQLRLLDEALQLCNQLLVVDQNDISVLVRKGAILCKTGSIVDGLTILKNVCEPQLNRDIEELNLSYLSYALFEIMVYYKEGVDKRIEIIFQKSVELFGSESAKKFVLGLFAISRFFEKNLDFDNAFKWMDLANDAHRRTYSYSSNSTKKSIERLINLFPKTAFENKNVGCQATAPIFIVGMPRSGTTLIEQILSSHSLIKGCGELGTMRTLCDAFQSEHELEGFDKWSHLLESLGSDYISHVQKRFGSGVYLVDKMPENFLYLGFIATALPQAKIIHCKRSPLETCISIYKQKFVGDHFYAYTLKELGEYYLLYQDMMAYWSSMLEERIYHLEYESIVENTEEEVAQLLEYCGLKYEPSCLQFYENKNVVYTASAHQVKQPLYKQSLKISESFGEHFAPLKQALKLNK